MIFLCVYDKNLMKRLVKSMQEIKLTTKDNIKIAINYYKKNFEKVIIISPGWFMTKDSKSFREMSEIFCNYADVITIDFRGHGKSGGFYTFTSKEVIDINTVIDFAKTIYKEIYLIGFSLGGAISLIAASKCDCIKKIIVVSTPSCFEKIENKMWKKEAWLPTLRKCELNRWFSIRPGLLNGKKIRPIDIIDSIKIPTLFIAGEKDPTVCFWHTKALYEKAVCMKKYQLFENCAHAEDLFIEDREKFIKICFDWFFGNN